MGMMFVSLYADAQKVQLKRLEYNYPEDSAIGCGPQLLWVADTLTRKPGELVDGLEVYCRDCWNFSIHERSVKAKDFLEHRGDTVTIDECEFLTDTARTELQRLLKHAGDFRLVRRTASVHSTAPSLSYEVVFNEPVQFRTVYEFVRVLAAKQPTRVSLNVTGGCAKSCIVPNDRVFDHRRSSDHLYNNGLFDNYEPATRHSRTRGWFLYSIKAPMAWVVTMGYDDVIIGARDRQVGCDEFENNDLVPRIAAAGTGNVREITGSITAGTPGVNRTQNTGNGLDLSTMPLMSGFNDLSKSDHSMNCMSVAIGRADNDNWANPNNGPEGSAVGSAPKCSGMLFLLNESNCPGYDNGSANIEDLDHVTRVDLDFTIDTDEKRSIVDVLYHPYNGLKVETEGVRRGVIQVASAGNDAINVGYIPRSIEPASTQYLHPTNPELDTKVIAVAAIGDGERLTAADCSVWNPSIPPPVWIGDERFYNSWNYSPGTNKFSVDTDIEIREADKKAAFVDLVAPGADIWVVHNHSKKYRLVYGTSLSAPLVAGVVGLMLSVSDHLGTPWDPITDWAYDWVNTSSGFDHQRRAYDILTFTADKVPDGNTNFPYVYQTADKLKRHWAQRMGFGKVNAYRSVAHAVPHKAEYEFTFTQTLSFDPAVANADGKKLMHMGSAVHHALDLGSDNTRGGGATGLLKVLEWGGTNLTGTYNTNEYQNQGVTRLSSADVNVRTDLTVPEDCFLLIDGRVLTNIDEFTQSQNRIIATANGTRILMEGYLQNVELVGALTLGDVIVSGTDLAPGLFFNRESDVYGNVRLINDAWCTISGTPDNTATTLRPGSHIQLNGNRNLMVRWGGVVEMDHSSRISTDQSRIVLVESGTLRVKPGAKVRLDAHVHIWDGQVLEIEDSAVVYIKS